MSKLTMPENLCDTVDVIYQDFAPEIDGVPIFDYHQVSKAIERGMLPADGSVYIGDGMRMLPSGEISDDDD